MDEDVFDHWKIESKMLQTGAYLYRLKNKATDKHATGWVSRNQLTKVIQKWRNDRSAEIAKKHENKN